VLILYSYLLNSLTFTIAKMPKTLKWLKITSEEMRKFGGLIILMGQVRKERGYWSTDPTISTLYE